MENIIQHFIENLYKNNSLSAITSFLNDNLNVFALNLIKNLIEEYDYNIRKSKKRKKSWDIVRINTRTIQTHLGKLTFNHTYYRNKKTKKYSYLLDNVIGIKKYQRLDAVLEGKILKSACLASSNTKVSKQTVKNIVADFGASDSNFKVIEHKKIVKTLYIEADEDHISFQKDTKKSGINKLIYIHEGKIKEHKNRNFLVNKYIFASCIKNTEDLWIEVYDYIDKTYEVDKIENIFILGDGAKWIKTAPEWILGATNTLDGFHLNKALLNITGRDNKEAYREIKELVYSLDKNILLKGYKNF